MHMVPTFFSDTVSPVFARISVTVAQYQDRRRTAHPTATVGALCVLPHPHLLSLGTTFQSL